MLKLLPAEACRTFQRYGTYRLGEGRIGQSQVVRQPLHDSRRPIKTSFGRGFDLG